MFHTKQDVDRHVNEVFKNIKNEYQRDLKCYQIAKLYFKFKDYKSAIKYLNRYILINSNSAAAHRLLGECYLGCNLKVKALESFKTSLVLNGSQHDLVLKICTLLMDPEVSAATPRATYWLERAEALFPKNPIVFQLREHLLKTNLGQKQDNEQLEKLILTEINARPTDVIVRIRLLNFFMETKRYQLAYQHALEIEERHIFARDIRWYDCLCNLVQVYEKVNTNLGLSFYIRKIIFLEKRADLFMQEFQQEIKPLPECSAALFAFDQNLHSVSKIEVSQEETLFFNEFMKHMRVQLSFHLATLVLKRAKKEYGVWQKAFRTFSPLLLQATQRTMDLDEPSYNVWIVKNKLEGEVKQLSKSANLRVSQAGHILLSCSQSKGSKFLEKVSQFCGGKWQTQAYQDIFCNREHQQAANTSHFVNDPFFATVPMRLLSETELVVFDEVSQSAYPDSLHHLVWLGLAYCNSNGQLNHDFRCFTVPDLQFTVANLAQTGAETLNQLDVDAFLYASVLCAKSATPNNTITERPSKLPINISDELCTTAQADWWVAVYKTYTNQVTENIGQMRLNIRRGIEVVRVCGQHGLHPKVIVMLAKLFQERATKSKNINEVNGLEERAHLYWSAAIPALEKMEKNQQVREVPNRLFDYKGKDLTPNEIKGYLEDAKLFLACRLMKQGKHDQAIEAFQALKSPFASFYQALIYEKLASEEVNHRPESITSENRSQHIILLTRARDAFYLTLDRLRCPSVDPNHPLNSKLQDYLELVEKQLAVIDPDNTLNRNGESQSDETDTAGGPLSPDADENLDSSFNIFNTSNFLNVKNHSTLRSSRPGKQNVRYEARPSLERLDAQLRHLVQANSNGLHAVVEQLKEIKTTMLIELKDLGCVTRDLLAGMKRWNDKLEVMLKRSTDFIKPEDLAEFRDEDYDDFTQLSQPYAPYPNYSVNRQMTGTQGTSTVTYGTHVPSPVPPVPPVLTTPENPLMPPNFYSGPHPVPSLDPSLLLYQSLGYYAPGMPYVDGQNVADYRASGIQKGAPFVKNNLKAPDSSAPASILTTKPQSPNVVITSSDTLPAFTSAGTPAMSVTIPPHHIRGPVPVPTQKLPPGQTHTYPIPMPPQAQLVKESPAEKLNALTTTTSVTISPIPTALPTTTKPGIQQTTLPKKDKLPTTVSGRIVNEPKIEGNKLFDSRGKLGVFEREWKEKGTVFVKITHDEKLGKVRVTMIQEPDALILEDHYIAPNTMLETQTNEKVWTWAVSNLQKVDVKPNEAMGMKMVWQKFRVEFQTLDEAKDFEFAFNEGRRIAKGKSENESSKPRPMVESKGNECKTCKKKFEGNSEECSTCESKKKQDKSILGGFTFNTSPIVKPPTLDLSKPKEKSKETETVNPFAALSFSTPTTTTSKTVTQSNTPTSTFGSGLFTSSTTTSENLFSGVKADPNSFKKDANKDFEGKGSLVFGHLKPKKTDETSTKNKKEEDEDDDAEEFVPSTEFTPVVDLPPLIDVRTGEENDVVLYDERAKLLRFDTNLKEWKERGVGQMKVLLNKESGKVRLIMRRELVLKVCCNHYLDDSMEFKRMTKSEKALTWHAQDYSEGELKSELLALKFANPDSMVRFESAVKKAQTEMKNGLIKKPEEKESTHEPAKEKKPLSELFKPKPGTWECGACLIRNNESALKCISCETPKPGTESSESAPTSKSSDLGKGITLTPTTKFTFGIPQSTSVTTTVSKPSSIFGSGPPQTSTAASGFNFGSPQTTSTTTTASKPGSILGGAATQTPTASGFTFGLPQSTVTTTVSMSSPIFGGGALQSGITSSGFTFGMPQSTSASTTVSMSSPIFGSSNFTFAVPQTSTTTSSVNQSGTKSPSIFGGGSAQTTPTASGFTFGVPQSTSVTTTISTSSPIFGNAPPQTSTAASGFIFGSPQATSTAVSKPASIFGGATTQTTPSASSFTFGSPQSTSVTTTVSMSAPIFGSSNFTFAVPQTSTTTNSANQTGTKFLFGSQATTTPSSTSTETSTVKTPEGSVTSNSSSSSFSFLAPKLNIKPADSKPESTSSPFAVTTQTNTTSAVSFSLSAPKFTFTPSNSPSTMSEGTSVFGDKKFTFTIGKADENKSESPVVKPSGTSATSLNTEGKEKFEFSLSSSVKTTTAMTTTPITTVDTATLGSAATKSSPSSKEGASHDASSENSDEDPEDDSGGHFSPIVPLPDKVAAHTGEEDEDVLYQNRAKLYRFIDKEWKERGLGDVKILKHKINNKIRLLMRRETILKVCLNHYVTPDIQFNPKDEKTWTWTAGDFSEEEVRYDMFAIRFKTPEIAKEFKKVLDDAKTSMSSLFSSNPQDENVEQEDEVEDEEQEGEEEEEEEGEGEEEEEEEEEDDEDNGDDEEEEKEDEDYEEVDNEKEN